MEYRGHWVRISRAHGLTAAAVQPIRVTERLDGSYPYEMGYGKITSEHVEYNVNGKRLFYGDTAL